MSGQGGKRKASGSGNPSPTKKHNPGDSKKKGKGKHKETTPPRQMNPSGGAAASSPLKTPKTPYGVSKIGIRKETAKSLMKHDSKLGALYNMLYGFAHIILDKKPETEDDFKPLLDELAAQ